MVKYLAIVLVNASALLALVLLGMLIGGWSGFITWLVLGLIALIMFFAMGGRPWGFMDSGALVAGGYLSFAVFSYMLFTELPKESARQGRPIRKILFRE